MLPSLQPVLMQARSSLVFEAAIFDTFAETRRTEILNTDIEDLKPLRPD